MDWVKLFGDLDYSGPHKIVVEALEWDRNGQSRDITEYLSTNRARKVEKARELLGLMDVFLGLTNAIGYGMAMGSRLVEGYGLSTDKRGEAQLADIISRFAQHNRDIIRADEELPPPPPPPSGPPPRPEVVDEFLSKLNEIQALSEMEALADVQVSAYELRLREQDLEEDQIQARVNLFRSNVQKLLRDVARARGLR